MRLAQTALRLAAVSDALARPGPAWIPPGWTDFVARLRLAGLDDEQTVGACFVAYVDGYNEGSV